MVINMIFLNCGYNKKINIRKKDVKSRLPKLGSVAYLKKKCYIPRARQKI